MCASERDTFRVLSVLLSIASWCAALRGCRDRLDHRQDPRPLGISLGVQPETPAPISSPPLASFARCGPSACAALLSSPRSASRTARCPPWGWTLVGTGQPGQRSVGRCACNLERGAVGGGLANCSACCILKNRGLKWEVLRVVGPSARSGLGAGARDAARLAGRAANRLNL